MAASRVVLCADDYGLSPGVSQGIRELLDRSRITATSCMVVFPEFARDGALLRPYLGRADIGLHFTLTAKRPLRSVVARMYLRPPGLGEMIAEVESQVAAFRATMGRLPDYIDGHQHVHLLPIVREAVVRVARDIGAYVRLTREPIDAAMCRRPAALESAALSLQSRPLERLARELGVHGNRGFRGVRSFKERGPFQDLFLRMIAGAKDGWLIMCHPGWSGETLTARDRVSQAREAELRYLQSESFPRDLAQAGLVLSRLHEANPSTGTQIRPG